MIFWDKVNRRLFLERLGQASLMLPILPSLLAKEALAQGGIGNRSTIFIQGIHGGLRWEHWVKDWNNKSAMESPVTMPGFSYAVQRGILTKMAQANGGRVSDLFDSSCPISRMVIGAGCDNLFGISHTRSNLGRGDDTNNYHLHGNGFNPQITADAIIAHSRNAHPIFISENDYGKRISRRYEQLSNINSRPITSPAFTNSQRLFDAFFQNSTLGTGGTGGTTTTTTVPKEKLVVDLHLDQLKQLQNSGKLGQEDDNILKAFMELIFGVQAKYSPKTTSVTFQGCYKPSRPPVYANPSYGSDINNIRNWYRSMNDVIVALVACNAAPAIAYQAFAIDFLRDGGNSSPLHAAAHAGDMSVILPYHQSLVKYVYMDLVNKLAAFKTSSGDLLKESMAMFFMENTYPHHCQSNFWALAGEGGGAIKTNQFINFRDPDPNNMKNGRGFGISWAHLLANIARAAGVSKADISKHHRCDNLLGANRTGLYPDRGYNSGSSEGKTYNSYLFRHYGKATPSDFSSPLSVLVDPTKLA